MTLTPPRKTKYTHGHRYVRRMAKCWEVRVWGKQGHGEPAEVLYRHFADARYGSAEKALEYALLWRDITVAALQSQNSPSKR